MYLLLDIRNTIDNLHPKNGTIYNHRKFQLNFNMELNVSELYIDQSIGSFLSKNIYRYISEKHYLT